jgi:hypothetical protein
MHKNSLKKTAFKTCGTCDTGWITRSEFIGCRSISLVGYQSNFERIEEGLFLFNHTIESCGSTISVQVGKFADLYAGEKYSEAKFGRDECERRCIDESNLERCDQKCRYAYVREILQILSDQAT